MLKTSIANLAALALSTPFLVAQTPEKPVTPSSLEVARRLAAKEFAGFTYAGKKPAPKTVDEQGFVVAVILEMARAAKKDLDADKQAALTEAIRMSSRKNKEVQTALTTAVRMKKKKVVGFEGLPAWTAGVQKALTDAGLGTVVAPKDAKVGDFVQWWFQFKSGNWGTHVGIIESLKKGKATIYGAHKSSLQSEKKAKKKKGGIGTGPALALTKPVKKIFVVRFKD